MTRGDETGRYRAPVPRRRRDPRSPLDAVRQPDADPYEVLGLTDAASEREIRDARRRLAKAAHPDAGGSVEAMQRVNDAATAALGRRRGGAPPRSAPRRPAGGPMRRDHPSFTVEALPAEAFEALRVVASWIGEPIDDDPPYLLEVALTEPIGGWCRLDLVPDAGASTVSVAVAGAPGHPAPTVELVRDAFVDGLNRLDWGALGS